MEMSWDQNKEGDSVFFFLCLIVAPFTKELVNQMDTGHLGMRVNVPAAPQEKAEAFPKEDV